MPRSIMQRLFAGWLAAALFAGAAAAQQAPQPKLVIPPDEALAIMIKTTLIGFNNANLTGNYSVFRDLASPNFRDVNTPARLAEIFQDLRKRNIDLGPIVLFQPKLLREPLIDERRLLQMSGFFATRPERVNFDLAYQEVEGRWRLFGIRVTTEPVGDAGPTANRGEPAAEVETTAGSNQPSTGLPLPRPRPVP